jgi:stearoyl-CoA desaturase (delta-9 desaturase)
MPSSPQRHLDAVKGPYRVHSLTFSPDTDAVTGRVLWDGPRSLWNGSMMAASLILGPLFFTWSALGVFLILLFVIICTGHSVGFHRRLIHRSFHCSRWTERLLVWSGTLVGMQGPFWMIRSHDMRDWAQRQTACHPYLRHGTGLLRDAWWNLHCKLELDHAPAFDPGPGIGDDRFYQFLQKTWMLQQLPLALALYALGGWAFVIWGICARVSVGVTAHWYIGHLCHTRGPQNWLVDDGCVQAHDAPWAALISMGESFHNNHHAFPASAQQGLFPGQMDLGFRFIQMLGLVGLAWNIRTPHNLPHRAGLTPVTPQARELLEGEEFETCPFFHRVRLLYSGYGF